jgi:FkbM family methyltransferase
VPTLSFANRKASDQNHDGSQSEGRDGLGYRGKQRTLLFLDDARGRTFRPRARFEPQPEMRNGIERQKLRFDWSNLRVMNIALLDLDGEMNLSRQRIGDGSATLEVTRRRSTDATLNVQVAKLDTIADEIFSKLKFTKCDVEGHELNVFLGGAQTIRNR